MAASSHLKGVLVALHLVAITVMALPEVGDGLNRKAWSDPTVQGEFDAWHARLSDWGLGLSRDAFEEQAWSVAQGWAVTHDALKAPFWPYLRYCGTWQGWRMFVAPHRYPSRLVIELHEGEAWRTLYVARSDEYAWHRAQFDHHRMRSAMFRFAWPNYRKAFTQFSERVAKDAAAEFPEADRVRLRFRKTPTPTAAQQLAGELPASSWHTPREHILSTWR